MVELAFEVLEPPQHDGHSGWEDDAHEDEYGCERFCPHRTDHPAEQGDSYKKQARTSKRVQLISHVLELVCFLPLAQHAIFVTVHL